MFKMVQSRLLILLLAAGGLLGSLSACNTMRGAGQDISATGQALEETAVEVQQEM